MGRAPAPRLLLAVVGAAVDDAADVVGASVLDAAESLPVVGVIRGASLGGTVATGRGEVETDDWGSL